MECNHSCFRIINKWGKRHEFLCLSCNTHDLLVATFESDHPTCDHKNVLFMKSKKATSQSGKIVQRDSGVITSAKCQDCSKKVKPIWKILDRKNEFESCGHEVVFFQRCLFGQGYGHKIVCEGCKSVLSPILKFP